MECKNCGSPILEGDRFCSKCGTRVAEESQDEAERAEEFRDETERAEESRKEAERAEESRKEAEGAEESRIKTSGAEGKEIPLCIPEEVPSRSNSLWRNMFKGKKVTVNAVKPEKRASRVIPVILGAVVVILIANSAKLINSYHKIFSTPEEYYRWVERRSIHKNAEIFAEYYANYILEYLRGYDSRTSGEICLELGNAGRELLESAGLEPWFQEGTFTYETTCMDEVEQRILGIEIEGEKLFGLDTVMDLRDEAVYLGFPGLTEKYLALDTEGKDFVRIFEDVAGMKPEEYLREMELLEAFYKECPDKKQVKALVDRYLELLLDCIGDVEMRTGKTVRAGSVAQTCTTLEIYLDKDDIRNMLSEFLKELREESEVEALLHQIFELVEKLEPDEGYYRDAEEYYEAFRDRIDEILDDLDYYVTYHNDLNMTVYVDNKGQIIGRVMEFPNSWDEVAVSCLFPHRGSRFGYKASVVSNDGEIMVTGSGREFWNKIDGSFTVQYDGNGIIDVEVEDFDLKSLKKGFLNGCFTVTASSGIRRIGDMGMVHALLASPRLVLDVSMGRSSRELGIELREGRVLWGALTITVRNGDGKKIAVPTTKKAIFVEDGSDFADWWDTIEWEKLIKSMDKAGMPSDSIERMKEYSGMDAGEVMDKLLELISGKHFPLLFIKYGK